MRRSIGGQLATAGSNRGRVPTPVDRGDLEQGSAAGSARQIRDLIVGSSDSNRSPVLQLFLARLDELIERVAHRSQLAS